MAKKTYKSPIFFSGELPVGEDPILPITDSQGTSGYDSRWSFEGISDSDLGMIDLNCDDFDLQDMDSDGNYIITQDELDAWLRARGGWN